MRNAVATRSTPRGIEVEYQNLSFVLRKNGALTVGELPTHVGERCCTRRRHRVSGAGWWARDYWCWLLGVFTVACGEQHQQYDYKKVSRAKAQRRKGDAKGFVTLLCVFASLREKCFFSSHHPQFHVVPAVRAHRAHDTHPQPSGQGQQVDSVHNKRDGKDCLSTRLAYRRLDTS